jgi:hypothetical protein
MSNIQSSFEGLSKKEFLDIRNEIFRASEGMTDKQNVDVRRDDATGRVMVRIVDLQVDNIGKMLGLLAVLGSNAIVETDERKEMRKRSGEQEEIGRQAA